HFFHIAFGSMKRTHRVLVGKEAFSSSLPRNFIVLLLLSLKLYVQETAKRSALFPPIVHFWITALRTPLGNKFATRPSQRLGYPLVVLAYLASCTRPSSDPKRT